jgi:hypothetical protein
MTIPYNQQAYAQSTGTSQIPSFVFETRDPTSNDYNPSFKIYMGWVNTVTKAIWYLEAINASNGVLTPQWRAVGPIVVASVGPATPLTSSSDYAYPIGQTWVDSTADDYYVMVSNPTATTGYWIKLSAGTQGVDLFAVDAHTAPGTSPVGPDGSGIVTVTGGQVAAGTTTNVIRTDSLAANTYTIEIQRSQAVASSTVGDNGVSHFNSGDFTVDSNGFVSAISSGYARLIDVDAHTAPGTDPVVPTSSGVITVTGGQVAAGTTANVIQTNSLAANTYTVQVQRSQAVASSTVGDNGVCHFNSSEFTVDSNGFVSLSSGGSGITTVKIQSFTASGTYTPTAGMVYAQIELCGGGGGGGNSTTAATQTSVGSGGSAGGYARKIFDAATIGASQSVTIGAGGTAGNPGGTTSVGALISATGGGAGETVSSSTSAIVGILAPGGSGTGGTVNITGGSGGGAAIIIDTGVSALGQGGVGGDSYFGGSPVTSYVVTGGTVTSNGTSASTYGAGGSGAASINPAADATGGSGGGGIVIITEFIA